MAFKSHLTARVSSKAAGGGKSKGGVVYGRVIKTILTLSDPDCKDSSMLNGVFYRIPKQPGKEDVDTGIEGVKPFARQGNASMRVIPMPGELVEIVPALGLNATAGKVMYWGRIVNVWNHPHHNAIPDTKQENWGDRLIGGQPEESTINPLQANPGDTILEGRLGQSVRFGGYAGTQSKNIDISNEGKPIILISNGQIKTQEGDTPIEEDINNDFNSLHFLSDHKSELKSVNTKRDSYDVQPLQSDKYIGNQVLVNGGRLYFNAKDDSAFISARESIGLNARTLNLDATDYFCIDSKKIYLGKAARTSNTKEPVVLGKQLENWLTTLLDTLENIAMAMSTASAVTGGPVTQLNAAGPELRAVARSLKSQILLFQSKKVFTE
jgi:hypothetical protein